MITEKLDIVILGLSITSSWGNGHATTFRGLIRELDKNGHRVTFLERDVPWYASNRDMPSPPFCQLGLYRDVDDLKSRFSEEIEKADMVIVGSYVPEGVEVGTYVIETAKGITAFYDIDTPVTFAKLMANDYEYLHPNLIGRYQLYLSFTGGSMLKMIEDRYGSPMARPFYCSVDPSLYYRETFEHLWDLGYLGTFSTDRQPPLQKLMLDAAIQDVSKKFVVAGSQYPSDIEWPPNVEYINHLPPAEHRKFYNSQRFALNITRADMIRAGYSPSVRLFEAAACGVCIISDYWEGIETLLEPGNEILISENSRQTLEYLNMDQQASIEIGERGRQKVLSAHTAAHRAKELERHYAEALHKTGVTLQNN